MVSFSVTLQQGVLGGGEDRTRCGERGLGGAEMATNSAAVSAQVVVPYMDFLGSVPTQ